MAAVKGSKQYEMMVVPHRPLYKVAVFTLFMLFMATFSFLTHEFGKQQGLAHEAVLVREKDVLQRQIAEMRSDNAVMRSEIANLRLGGQVDSRATEEVRGTIEELQSQVAQLNEEITFYKGVMLPNVEDQGLRIERLNMEESSAPDRFRYSLLLTQVVDKHEYVQGDVEINLVGVEGQASKAIPLRELDKSRGESILFRFKYFQNIDGELTLPKGFEPREFMVVAVPSGRKAQRLERKFVWQLNGG
ncbi:MAG: hypothetical protein O2780_18035 [Proteobacteria bacterium]|nr:hypothetical protein [Pseudomonadota bacterium]MDA1300294.1 hypothetical protein [Pseudomonadota bacterium]